MYNLFYSRLATGFSMRPLLQLRDVRKTYRHEGKEINALQGVSFDINAGEIIGLLGVNGAGKTTLSSIIATLHPATSGTLLYQGQNVYDNLLQFRYELGYCPQKINVDKSLTIKENLWYAGRFYGLEEPYLSERVAQLLAQFSLEKYADMKPEVLSGGYARRLLLARALIHKPKLVILDEPTVGLDPHIRRQLWDIVKQLKAEGITVILTTHYLDEAEELSDRVVVLEKGQVRVIETPANLKALYNMGNLEDVFLHLMNQNKE
jgi:ABC-2 type transport system ATP-binding protein